MGITRSLLFCSLYGGALRACWGCSTVHYIPIFFLALAASLWIFCLLHWLLWGVLWSLHILFLCMCTTLHADLSMTVHLLNEICFCLGTPISRIQMGDVDTWDGCHQIPIHATLLLRYASTLTQACSLTLSGCSVQVNRVLAYRDLDEDLMKYAAFQTLVSGCCNEVTAVTPPPSRLPSSSTVTHSCIKYTALSCKQLPLCFQVCSSLQCGFHTCLCL